MCGDGEGAGHAQAVDVFAVMGDAVWVAVTPFGKDFVAVGELPVGQLLRLCDQAGFFLGFPACGVREGFVAFLAACDGLPESGVCGAFQQQYFKRWCVDEDEDGNGFFCAGHGG